ncbi:MAG: phage holin family protein [Gemmatimonadaceae bacterium]
MEAEDHEIPVRQHRELGRGDLPVAVDNGASIGELFRRLGTDTGALIRAEASLAKAEVRESAARIGRDAAKVGIAAGLALVGLLSLSAFVIIGLGMLLGGAFWLSALIVGALTLGIGATLVRSAVRDLSTHSLGPQETIRTLKEDSQWVAREAKELKQGLTSNSNAPTTRR